MKKGYKALWKSIIRPPRESYSDFDLGPSEFTLGGKAYKRTDFSLANVNGYWMKCSHFEPFDSERTIDILPCVIYLHGNSSSRTEGLVAVPLILPMNATLVVFDFAGCGISDGEYITLGWNERHDVRKLITYLKENRRVGKIGLWGRSMGAATAIFYACANDDIDSMVLDSPFASLKELSNELGSNYTRLPNFVRKILYNMIRKTVMKRAKFDINEINPIDQIDTCFQPVLFGAGINDLFVRPHHTQELYDKCPGEKDIILFEGDHNSIRPKFFHESVSRFFYLTLMCDRLPEAQKSTIPEFNGKISQSEDLLKEMKEDEEAMLKWALDESVKLMREQTNPE